MAHQNAALLEQNESLGEQLSQMSAALNETRAQLKLLVGEREAKLARTHSLGLKRKNRVRQPERDVITEAELAEMLKRLGKRHTFTWLRTRLCMLVCHVTGLRISELHSIK